MPSDPVKFEEPIFPVGLTFFVRSPPNKPEELEHSIRQELPPTQIPTCSRVFFLKHRFLFRMINSDPFLGKGVDKSYPKKQAGYLESGVCFHLRNSFFLSWFERESVSKEYQLDTRFGAVGFWGLEALVEGLTGISPAAAKLKIRNSNPLLWICGELNPSSFQNKKREGTPSSMLGDIYPHAVLALCFLLPDVPSKSKITYIIVVVGKHSSHVFCGLVENLH